MLVEHPTVKIGKGCRVNSRKLDAVCLGVCGLSVVKRLQQQSLGGNPPVKPDTNASLLYCSGSFFFLVGKLYKNVQFLLTCLPKDFVLWTWKLCHQGRISQPSTALSKTVGETSQLKEPWTFYCGVEPLCRCLHTKVSALHQLTLTFQSC